MFFSNKDKKEGIKCSNCRSKVTDEYSYCPYCGNTLVDFEKQNKDFGMLGNNDGEDEIFRQSLAQNNLSFTDKMISALMTSLMKNIDQQFREIDGQKSNGSSRNVKIKIGVQNPRSQNTRVERHNFSDKKISEEQLKKMSSLPRTSAKTNIKRLGNKVIYELETRGLDSVNDIFVSKLESGYEIKALAKEKIYVNSLPVNLPISSLILEKDSLFIEFSHQ